MFEDDKVAVLEGDAPRVNEAVAEVVTLGVGGDDGVMDGVMLGVGCTQETRVT